MQAVQCLDLLSFLIDPYIECYVNNSQTWWFQDIRCKTP